MNTIKERLAKLRQEMKHAGIDAYIIPSWDAHLSEYTPTHWKSRTWISGFNGSAGTVVVLADKAGLWTDSRYFLQASQQLQGTGIDLMKEGLPDTPSIPVFLSKVLPEGSTVGFDGMTYPLRDVRTLDASLKRVGISLKTDKDLIESAWEDRPEIPRGELFLQKPEFSGETTRQRLSRVNLELKSHDCNAVIVSMLDEVAWAFNLRGQDVDFNPVGVAYGFISEKENILFVYPEKLPDAVRKELEDNHVIIRGYEEIYDYVAQLDDQTILYVDPARINLTLFECIPSHCRCVEELSLIAQMKSIKNETECAGTRRAMTRDGVALTRFFMWLEKELQEGRHPDEYEIGIVLADFRSKQDLYFSDSFAPIAGYRGHGAIVHYSASKESAYKLDTKGLFLLDSGGQYLDGTTDITRTIALGTPTEEEKRDYTLVLKGHIAIATAIFPLGTRGAQLDALARHFLWEHMMHYGHGTGHGVGHFLNVHEGPQNIRLEENPTILKPGMLTSNEPGLYKSDRHGIRIENLILAQVEGESEFGTFLSFETVTICYMDNNLIDKTLLSDTEIAWYNAYQKRVFDTLSPHLEPNEVEWLRNKTQSI